MLSVRCDAFLSKLLCHSHQVSGVWVAKTVKRNKGAISKPSLDWAEVIGWSGKVYNAPAFAYLHLSRLNVWHWATSPYVPARPAQYWGLVVNVIPSDDILHARCHGGTDSEDKALFKGPAQQTQHTVSFRAVREVGHAVCSWVSNTWIWMLWLQEKKNPYNKAMFMTTWLSKGNPHNYFCLTCFFSDKGELYWFYSKGQFFITEFDRQNRCIMCLVCVKELVKQDNFITTICNRHAS